MHAALHDFIERGTARTTRVRLRFIVFLFILAVDLALIKIFWRQTNTDLTDWVLPWYVFLRRNGLAAFATDFSIYTPPYLYFLGLGTLFDGLWQPAIIIRGISVIFNVAAAALVFWFARMRELALGASVYAAATFFMLPGVIVNSAVWGQCDIIYRSFLMLFVCFVIERRGWAATTALGVAFAFKQQTAFIAPFVLYLLLS